MALETKQWRNVELQISLLTYQNIIELSRTFKDSSSFELIRRIVEMGLANYHGAAQMINNMNATELEEIFELVMQVNAENLRISTPALLTLLDFWAEEVDDCVI